MNEHNITNAPEFVESPEEAVARLAALPMLKYEQARTDEAKRLGLRVSALDKAVNQLRAQAAAKAAEDQAKDLLRLGTEHSAWAKPVDGRKLLDQIHTYLRRFMIASRNAFIAITLWIVFTHLIDNLEVVVSPRLKVTSPEKRCGKTRLFELISPLVFRPLSASNITAAVVYRACDIAPLTLLLDEADTYANNNNELRGILNSGYTRSGAHAIRNISPDGHNWAAKTFSTWGAAAVASIGKQPDTWTDRSIAIRLRRRLKTEKIERLLQRDKQTLEEIKMLAQKIRRWIADNENAIVNTRCEPLSELTDRGWNNWEMLFAIAEVAGGEWPARAREATLALSAEPDDADSLKIKLLSDVRVIFDESDAKIFSSLDLCRRLIALEGRPWAEPWHGSTLTQNRLATLLKPFNIFPTTVWPQGRSAPSCRGYKRRDFLDSFKRYLDPVTLSGTDTATQTKGQKGKSAVTLKTTKRNTSLLNGKVPTLATSGPVRKFSKGYKPNGRRPQR